MEGYAKSDKFALKILQLLRTKAISRLISLALILSFAIGIAPKQFLHDLLANHTDKPVTKASGNISQVQTSGFQCDNESTVATSPFEAAEDIIDVPPKTIFRNLTFCVASPLFTVSHRTIDLRGPPVVG